MFRQQRPLRKSEQYKHNQDKIDVYFGTFAKSFASIGGFSAASKEVIEWILYNARTQVFAKSLPMVYVKTLSKALDLIIDGDRCLARKGRGRYLHRKLDPFIRASV